MRAVVGQTAEPLPGAELGPQEAVLEPSQGVQSWKRRRAFSCRAEAAEGTAALLSPSEFSRSICVC